MSTGAPTFSVQPGAITPNFNQALQNFIIGGNEILTGKISCNATQGANWLAFCFSFGVGDADWYGTLSFNTPQKKGFYSIPVYPDEPNGTAQTDPSGAYLQNVVGGSQVPSLSFSFPNSPLVWFNWSETSQGALDGSFANSPAFKTDLEFSSVDFTANVTNNLGTQSNFYMGLACFYL